MIHYFVDNILVYQEEAALQVCNPFIRMHVLSPL